MSRICGVCGKPALSPVQNWAVTEQSTEFALRDWRYGQTQAERLCAGILSIEGFSAVDPQHPLGGPDGLKDIRCKRGFTEYIAAAYFPPTKPTFSEIRSKFLSDLEGVTKNKARGFVFFVNQALTIGERQILLGLTQSKADFTDIFHLERLRSVLDSPQGCGLRLEYLRIAMTREEQIAYWSRANIGLEAKLDRIEALQLQTLHRVESSEDAVLRRTSALVIDLRSDLSSLLETSPTPGELWTSGPATSTIDVPVLLWLHRVLLAGSNLPPTLIGTLRTLSVSVGPADGSNTPYTPPAPEDLPRLIGGWCERWRSNYSLLLAQDADFRLSEIIKSYYEFLKIHPFTDGNGRMARLILDQMLRELLDKPLPQSFADTRMEHQDALQSADNGDLTPLLQLLATALF